MPMLRAAMLLLGVFAVLFLGGASAPAIAAEAVSPPCHEAPAQTPSGHDPDKAASAMACCIACVTAPLPAPLNETLVVHTASPTPGAMGVWAGRDPGPEPGPPRA